MAGREGASTSAAAEQEPDIKKIVENWWEGIDYLHKEELQAERDAHADAKAQLQSELDTIADRAEKLEAELKGKDLEREEAVKETEESLTRQLAAQLALKRIQYETDALEEQSIPENERPLHIKWEAFLAGDGLALYDDEVREKLKKIFNSVKQFELPEDFEQQFTAQLPTTPDMPTEFDEMKDLVNNDNPESIGKVIEILKHFIKQEFVAMFEFMEFDESAEEV